MPIPVPPQELRTERELEADFHLERELADRLRAASVAERTALYGALYDEYFRRANFTPAKADGAEDDLQTGLELQLLAPFLDARTRFLEIGAGTLELSRRVAAQVESVIAVEASTVAFEGVSLPPNGHALVADATRLELPDDSVDVAYSCHFIEHLHPEDASAHAACLHRVLAPGGVSMCVTPNRHWGPHDISRYFADTPLGFHLREYDHADLGDLFRQAGFRRVRVLRGLGGRARIVSMLPYRLLALTLDRLAPSFRRRLLGLASSRRREPFRRLEQVVVAAWR